MRAVWYERKGPAREVLEVGKMREPAPGPGEVLIRVHASAVNPSDTKGRGGWLASAAMAFPRIVPHQDGAGVIEATGADVSASRVGERVWIYEGQWRRPFGTAASLIALPADRAVPLPGSVSFAHGACLGIPVMTAHRSVFADGPVTGKVVLVTGGAGMVGYYAVQLAKWGGARVVATVSSPEKGAVAREAGADHVVDYRQEDVGARVLEITDGAGVDRVVEVAFGANLPVTTRVLATSGVVAAYASDAEREPRLPFRPLMAKDATIRCVLVYVMPRDAKDAAIRDITHLLECGGLRHRIHHEFALEETAAAHEAVEAGQRMGAVIVRVD